MSKRPSKRQAALRIASLYERNGYVRFKDEERGAKLGRKKYRKGDEVRLTAESPEEIEQIQDLLTVLEFTFGNHFAKGHQFRIPIYGREQVRRFLELIDEHSGTSRPR